MDESNQQHSSATSMSGINPGLANEAAYINAYVPTSFASVNPGSSNSSHSPYMNCVNVSQIQRPTAHMPLRWELPGCLQTQSPNAQMETVSGHQRVGDMNYNLNQSNTGSPLMVSRTRNELSEQANFYTGLLAEKEEEIRNLKITVKNQDNDNKQKDHHIQEWIKEFNMEKSKNICLTNENERMQAEIIKLKEAESRIQPLESKVDKFIKGLRVKGNQVKALKSREAHLKTNLEQCREKNKRLDNNNAILLGRVTASKKKEEELTAEINKVKHEKNELESALNKEKQVRKEMIDENVAKWGDAQRELAQEAAERNVQQENNANAGGASVVGIPESNFNIPGDINVVVDNNSRLDDAAGVENAEH